ncbi:formamidopyrimidine-DNA glycosylase [Rhodoferax lacus]|uniref:Formamidopyrimidine-DNA glycosylase n=1 Tax=Rhodoferax lacus TaxID=2184758 RepID=A0A3E1RE94_9BURK|nr:bifunctional DNA-formamidopyrimidine glycosylase/DNA-(apurinic or apyrimidinic site) lyase [Rhodoferax lacus]RFO97551.1 formamidopyrimidine-DNA glycosylase [Rhodoferax lacus]
MPELPEVEVTRLSFEARIRGATVLSASLGKPLRWPLGIATAQLQGQVVQAVRRRGKYLLIDLNEGLLLVHLGMSGSVVFADTLAEAGKHDHFDLLTTQGTLRLNDPRRFGAVVFAPSEADAIAQKLLGRLGVEPLGDGFDAATFYQALQQRKTAIKQVLLAGEVVVGVGNIYASEALFLAGIRPTTRANRLSRPRALRLKAAIRQVLALAVEKGGSTLRDFSNAQGESGHFQEGAMVYGRQGQPCRVCGTAIKGLRQGQRSTFFCPQCQKP